MKFIEITELQYHNKLLLNVNNIVLIDTTAQMILVNGTFADGNGLISVNHEDLEKVIKAINEEEVKPKEPLFKTIDGSYFTPTKCCTYEKRCSVYDITMVNEQGAGFMQQITEDTMQQIKQLYDVKED